MPIEQLKFVGDFRIYNKYGEIFFPGLTDLTYVDLQTVVTIQQNSAEVYDDNEKDKPSQGEKLNRPAIITLNNIEKQRNQTIDEREKQLIERIQNLDVSIKSLGIYLCFKGRTCKLRWRQVDIQS